MLEAVFQQHVVTLARLRGWLVHHTRPAKARSGRWVTPIQGDPGLPDLILARRGRVIMAELKSENGRLSGAQKRWIEHLDTSDASVEVFVWRPSLWDEIEEILR